VDSINPSAFEALAAVQRDLDAAGLSAYRMDLVLNGGESYGLPLVSAALPDGQFHGADVLEFDGNEAEGLLLTVARLVQDTLAEVECVFFPRCPAHGNRLAVPKVSATGSLLSIVWWCSGSGGHSLGGIGQLRPAVRPA
jgi:hypothetical protein